ncbi:hypothetical protein P8452_22061 [Trifolium repens]|nr:hypothetical protein P8452_22061 [Trifolium repens]
MTHRQKCRRCNKKRVLMKETLGSSSTNEVQFGEIPKCKNLIKSFPKSKVRVLVRYSSLLSISPESIKSVYCYVCCHQGLLEYR